MDRNRFKGFTLAEVLITLGIIGVVAAMTLPTVINNTKNMELQVRLQKTYSELNQLSRLFMEHHGVSVPDYIRKYGADAFYKEFPNYLREVYKTSNYTWTDVREDGSPNFPYDIHDFDGTRLQGYLCDMSGFRADILGRYLSFDDPPVPGYNGPRICVDLNGANPPNTIGIDMFQFLFTNDGFVIPEGQDHKDNLYNADIGKGGTLKASPGNCVNRSPWGCTYYALLDKNPKGNGRYWKDFIGRKLYK